MAKNISKNKIGAFYREGEVVEEGSVYVCVPCGYKKRFFVGMRFPACLGCMGKRWFKKGLETWEKLNTTHEN